MLCFMVYISYAIMYCSIYLVYFLRIVVHLQMLVIHLLVPAPITLGATLIFILLFCSILTTSPNSCTEHKQAENDI